MDTEQRIAALTTRLRHRGRNGYLPIVLALVVLWLLLHRAALELWVYVLADLLSPVVGGRWA